MDRNRQRARISCSIALVLGLHLTIIWLLLATGRQTRNETNPEALAKTLDIVFFPRQRPLIESKPIDRSAESLAPVHRSRVNRAPQGDVRPQTIQSGAVPAAVDWANELARTARDSVPEGSVQQSRDFGFPRHSAAPAGSPPEFGWDYVATHRIEPIAEGGLLVHLNDNCVIVLMPFPFAGCGIGKRKANAHLFDHMHDPQPDSPARDGP